MKPRTLEDEARLIEKIYQLKGDVNMLENQVGMETLEDVEMSFDGFDFDEFDIELTPETPSQPEKAEEVAQPEQPVNKPAKPKKKRVTKPKAEPTPEPTPETPKTTGDLLDTLDELGEEEQAPVQPTMPAESTLTVKEKADNGIAKLKDIETYLNARFVEREEVIKNVLRSLAIGTNMLLLGDPGTGKSDLIQTANGLIQDARYFSWLVNRTSDPAELVGPYSIKAMEQDKFIRKTEGKMPEAHICFIDEIKLGLLA